MNLPSSWARVSLGEIRIDLGTVIDPRRDGETNFVLYSVPQFESHTPEIVKGKVIGSSKQTIEPGTVLLCKINPRINRVWIVGNHTEGPLIASTEWIPFFPVDGVNASYLAYFLQQKEIRDYLAHNVSGVGGSLMRVRPTIVDKLEFRVAPENEQERIVGEIEKQFTRLDDAVAGLKRVQVNLKRYRASALKAACEGRLVPTEAELARKDGRDSQPASELLKLVLAGRRAKWEAEQLQKMAAAGNPPKNDDWKKKYKEPAVPDTANLHPIPSNWAWTSLEAVANIVDPNPSHRMPLYVPSGVPLISSENFIGNSEINFTIGKQVTLQTLTEQITRFEIADGTFALSRIGTIGKTRRLPTERNYCLSHALVVITATSALIDNDFLRLVCSSEALRSIAVERVQSVGVPDLGMAKIRTLPIPLMPLSEQHRIVQSIAKALSEIDRLNDAVKLNLVRSRHLRNAVLHDAFQGALVRQDANERPASTLLVRIRSQRLEETNSKAPVMRGGKRKPAITIAGESNTAKV